MYFPKSTLERRVNGKMQVDDLAFNPIVFSVDQELKSAFESHVALDWQLIFVKPHTPWQKPWKLRTLLVKPKQKQNMIGMKASCVDIHYLTKEYRKCTCEIWQFIHQNTKRND